MGGERNCGVRKYDAGKGSDGRHGVLSSWIGD